MLKRAPLRVHAPQTLFASIATPSAMAFWSSTIQSVLPDGRITGLPEDRVATDTIFDSLLKSGITPSGVTFMNVLAGRDTFWNSLLLSPPANTARDATRPR